MMENLAETLSSTPIIPKETLSRFYGLKAQIKDLENEANILNKEIKRILAEFLYSNLEDAIEPHQEDIDRINQLRNQLGETEDPTELAEIENEINGLLDKLNEEGITEEMINDYLSRDPYKVLAHTKFSMVIEGFKVSTSIQDRSKIDEDRAVAYLKSIGREDLIALKEVVNESALERAVYNREIDARKFKEACINENLVVSLSVK